MKPFGVLRPLICAVALVLALPIPASSRVLYSNPGPTLVNNNGLGTNLPGMTLSRDDTSSDRLYFAYKVDPTSDWTTENYLAGLQLFQGGSERLGVGNGYSFFAYSAFGPPRGHFA